jgi:hypothetical protein
MKVKKVPKPAPYETELLSDYVKGVLKSVATKSELSKLNAAARATAIKGRSVNVLRSSVGLQGIQAKAPKR